MSIESPSCASSSLPAGPFAELPAEWSEYPSAAEIAEFEAFMAEHGLLDTDEDREAYAFGHPGVGDLLDDPVQALGLLSGLGTESGSFDVGVLESLDLASVTDPADLVTVLQAVDKVEAWAHAQRIRVLTALAGQEPSGAYLTEMHLEHEVAVARRTSEYAAGRTIEVARTVTTTFPEFLAALRTGIVSWGHLAVLVDRTRYVSDEAALAEIAARALARARTRTAGQFAGEVEKLVSRFDPDAAERHRRARKKERKVWAKRLADGMGMLGYVDDWAVVNAVYQTLAADAKAAQQARKDAAAAQAASDGTDPDGDPHDADPDGADDGGATDVDEQEHSADSDRADALAARVLGTVAPDGTVTWDRAGSVQVHVNLVVDLLTLRREREGIGLIDGQPVPAQIAREYAAHARSWQRFVIDPDDGHLIDRGTRVYTDPHLRCFILARDICRNPVHQHMPGSARLEMDHALEFPYGPTSAANCGGVCTGSHQLKTHRLVDITDSAADGSCTWTTLWGQTIRIPARAFLDEPDPPEPAGPADPGPPPEPPPF